MLSCMIMSILTGKKAGDMTINYVKITALLILGLCTMCGVSVSAVDSTGDSLCGPLCLLEVCKLYSTEADLSEICEWSGHDIKFGTTMLGLLHAAHNLNLPAVPLELSVEQLKKEKSPGIAFVDNNHYVLVREIKGDQVYIQDPPAQPYCQNIGIFSKRWSGDILLFSARKSRQMKAEIENMLSTLDGPRCSLNTRKCDFGAVENGDSLRYVFPVLNSGSTKLQLRVKSSCGCVKSKLSQNVLEPGEQAEISVLLVVETLEEELHHDVIVRTNDVLNKHVTLTLSATVNKSLNIYPQNLWFGDVGMGEAVEHELLLVGEAEDSFVINKIEHPDWVTVEKLPTRHGKKMVLPLLVSVSNNGQSFTDNPSIKLYTSGEKALRYEIPLRGNFVQ